MWVRDDQQAIISVPSWNRAAQFGDGLFETLKISNGKAQLLTLHAHRLEQGLARLSIPCPMATTYALLEHGVAAMLEHTGLSEGVLKVLVSRGDSARGYGFDRVIKPRVTLFFDHLPKLDDNIYRHGVNLQHCQTQCSIQPQLAGIKHLNRLENVLAKAELDVDVFEGIMSNYLGQVIEGTMSNLFFEADGTLYTPQLNLSGVSGVMRKRVLDFLSLHGIPCVIAPISLDQLNQFQGAFMCNSVLSIVPIISLAGQPMVITPICQTLLTAAQSEIFYE